MDDALAVVAAVVASAFAVELGISYRSRPRLHAGVWATAMGCYAVATWALVVGLVAGWSGPDFRVFYLFGAIANIPLLAAGSVALVAGERAGRRFAVVTAGFVALGAVATVVAPLSAAVAAEGIPEGSELFPFGVEVAGFAFPGPRVFAIVAGAVGTVVIVGFAVVSAVRFWGRNRRLAVGNLLIVGGAIAPAAGGSLTALGEASALAVSLLVGAVLLYSGYRVASSARSVRPAS